MKPIRLLLSLFIAFFTVTAGAQVTTYQANKIVAKDNLVLASATPGRFFVAGTGGKLLADSLLTVKPGINQYLSINTPVSADAKTILEIQPPFRGPYQLPFTYKWHYQDNGDGTYNTPMQFGFNTDGTTNPALPGIGFSIEPRFITGLAHLLELHQNVYLPPSPGHSGGESVRILTPTFTVRDSLGNSDNVWDMRGTVFNIGTLTNRGYFSISGNAIGTTLGITDITTGGGLNIKTDGSSPTIYLDAVGGPHTLLMRDIDVVKYGTRSIDPYVNVSNPALNPGFYNTIVNDTLNILRTGTHTGIAFNFSRGNPTAGLKVDQFSGKSTWWTGGGGYYHVINTNNTDRVIFTSTGEVGIGTMTPDPAAALEIASTSKVLLPPRMSEAQRDAIASPPRGGMIYNLTTDSMQYYNGTAWVSF